MEKSRNTSCNLFHIAYLLTLHISTFSLCMHVLKVWLYSRYWVCLSSTKSSTSCLSLPNLWELWERSVHRVKLEFVCRQSCMNEELLHNTQEVWKEYNNCQNLGIRRPDKHFIYHCVLSFLGCFIFLFIYLFFFTGQDTQYRGLTLICKRVSKRLALYCWEF